MSKAQVTAVSLYNYADVGILFLELNLYTKHY